MNSVSCGSAWVANRSALDSEREGRPGAHSAPLSAAPQAACCSDTGGGCRPCAGTAPANMLSFDIEWQVEELDQLMDLPPRVCDTETQDRATEANTHRILELLAGLEQKATFFILGRIARDMPRLVRTIADAGHEIACHSLFHRRLYDSTIDEARVQLAAAKRYLEDASGQPVLGFRAPQFSITSKNPWAFELLYELGFRYDSSVFPTGMHDFYGIAGFPRMPFRHPQGLISIPLPVVRCFRRELPFGGGGYLRLYPLFLTKHLFRRLNRAGVPVVVYAHPYEVGDQIIRVPELPWAWKFRSFVGRRTTRGKLAKLIREFRFLSIKDYLDSRPIAVGSHDDGSPVPQSIAPVL